MTASDSKYNVKIVGIILVLIQVILIVSLVFIPSYRPLLKENLLLNSIGLILIIVGLIIATISSHQLGSSLTATPVPKNLSTLNTQGIYRYIRHPIYSSIILAALGVVLIRPYLSSLFIYILLIVFFNFKSRFEEKLLSQKFKSYAPYKMHSGRFLPRNKLTK